MKNVIIFQDFVEAKTYGHEWKQEELFNYFRAQVDNSIRLGWKPEDIVICTNLPFKYRGVCILPLVDLCQHNKYFNKQYGIAEILRRDLIREPFWFHDFDDWQLNRFKEFPYFFGDVGMCKYIDFTQWNTGSIFVKPTSRMVWELIVDFMKYHKNDPKLLQVGDENMVNYIYHSYPEIQYRFSELNTRYNMGATQFELRRMKAEGDILIGAFKPNEDSYLKFKNAGLVSSDLQEIFKIHGLIKQDGE